MSKETSVSERESYWLIRSTVVALVCGLTAGVLLGDLCSYLQPIGDIFVGLLRMTVLPYIMVSLIANFGRLSRHQSSRLARIGSCVLACMWFMGCAAVFLLAQTFPELTQGSFFSFATITQPESIDYLSVFVPANIFESLARNHVPAVVILSIWMGIVLSTIERRQVLIDQLDVLSQVLIKISRSIAQFTPIGVFAIAASTAGTISIEEFGRLQAYFLIYTVGSAAIGFLILPLFVTAFTPFTYRDVMETAGESMLIAFSTGKLIIVIPTLVEETEKLFVRKGMLGKDETPTVDVLYPLAYPFPHIGKLLSMLFVPFAAWFLGNPLDWGEYPAYLVAGVFSYFGGPLLAMPFLLEFMQLPHDMFQLFLLTGLWESRIGDAIGVMHLVAFSLVTTCAFSGQTKFSFANIQRFVLGTAVVASVCVGLLAVLTRRSIDNEYRRDEVLLGMQLLGQAVQHSVQDEPSPNPERFREGETLLDRVRRRGKIRVGYNEDKLPFAFINSAGDLVGFDIEMAHALAADLDVGIEFVRFDRTTLHEQVKADHFDVVMSGLVGTLERSEAMPHTRPYMDVTLGLVVPDFEVRRFRTLKRLQRTPGLRIGFVDLSRGFASRLSEALPDAELIELRTSVEFFEREHGGLDALLISAESGSAYTLLYPDFEVVLPLESTVSLPLFYALGDRSAEFREYLEHWIELKRRDGTTDRLYDHWILGKTPVSQRPSLERYPGCTGMDRMNWRRVGTVLVSSQARGA